MARQRTTGWRGLATSNIQIRDRMRTAFEAASASGEIRQIAVETYLQFVYIGTAAATTWTDYRSEEEENTPNSDGAAPSTFVPLPSPSAEEIERLQDEVESSVVLLLSPQSSDSPHTPG
jgi:hypothetical protein